MNSYVEKSASVLVSKTLADRLHTPSRGLLYLRQASAASFSENIWVAKRFKTKDGTIACTKWLHPNEWAKQHKSQPNYRSVFPNEIVLETDFPLKETNWLVAQTIMQKLREQGYGYRCYFSGNKSFHIHLFFKNLQVVE